MMFYLNDSHVHLNSSLASVSLENRKSVMVLPPILTVPTWSARAPVMFRCRNMLKRVSKHKHSCLPPTDM